MLLFWLVIVSGVIVIIIPSLLLAKTLLIAIDVIEDADIAGGAPFPGGTNIEFIIFGFMLLWC